MLFRGNFSGARESSYKPKDKPPVVEHFLGVYDEDMGPVELVYDPADGYVFPAPGAKVEIHCAKSQVWGFGKEVRYTAKSLVVLSDGMGMPLPMADRGAAGGARVPAGSPEPVRK